MGHFIWNVREGLVDVDSTTHRYIYHFRSNRNGVDPILKSKILSRNRKGDRMILRHGKTEKTPVYSYSLDDGSYVEIVVGTAGGSNYGLASGVGDLWYGSHFYSFSEKNIKKTWEEEAERIENEYGSTGKINKAIEILNDLTDDERHTVINTYCVHCGAKDVRCQCWNDD